MFQLYSHHQAYLQQFVELYKLNVYGMWDPSSEAIEWHVKVKNMNPVARQELLKRQLG
jgi:hypothetical protein